MAMRIEQGDITRLAVDAIVNAANQVMLGGHPDLEVVFCCFSSRDAEIYRALLERSKENEMQGGHMNIGNKLVVAGLLAGLVGCSTEETVYVDNMDKDAKAALATAVRHAGFELGDVKVTKLELDCEPASSVYEVEFKEGWYEYEFDVDAKSGRVLKMKKEFDW